MRERRSLIAAALAAGLLIIAAPFLLGSQRMAEGSSLSRDSRGWLAARRYLEERGQRVELLDHALDAPIPAGLLVLTFPWQEAALEDLGEGTSRHLRSGGSILFAYSTDPFDASAGSVAQALDLEWEEARGRPPLNPLRWRRYAGEEWVLKPDPSLGVGSRAARITAPRRAPRAPAGATVLLRAEEGRPIAFAFSRGQGRVVALPAETFSNARLGEPGNADLLETLRIGFSDPWIFDEFHHGLRAVQRPEGAGPERILPAYLLQVAFLYVLAVVAISRPFGPPWSEDPVGGGSAAAFLLGLGALHQRLGHEGEASSVLLARAREMDSRLVVPEEVRPEGGGFLELARRIGGAQVARRKSS